MSKFKLNEIVKVGYRNTWLSGNVVEISTRLTSESFEVNYNVMLCDGESTIVEYICEERLTNMQECYLAQFGEV